MNTLRVKLFVTSVGTWLEPSHLGDVLVRMSAALRKPRRMLPRILFVNGIDGIGRRGPLRRRLRRNAEQRVVSFVLVRSKCRDGVPLVSSKL